MGGKLPPDAVISPRSSAPSPIRTEDVEQLDPAYIAAQLGKLREALGTLARVTENRGHLVDEYNTTGLGAAELESILTLQPTYEYMPEKIESVIITGPAAANVTLTLGDRNWTLVIPASGVLVIAPIAILVGRSDTRQLTSGTAGQYSLELMGIADERFHG